MPDHAALIASLTLSAKVRLLTGASSFTLCRDESIGLDELNMSDGPTGVRGLKFSGGPRVALLPNASLLASAWSEDTAYEVGHLLAEEAMAQGIHVVLGPTINLHRTPLGGRLFEAYSEDPLLTGRLAAAYVRGLQEHGVGACLKHLVANESETERNTVNCVVDEATLREVYLLPFEIAVDEADPWSIMAAYNDVNGVPCTEQYHVNNDVVKGGWGYSGLIMSDWFATKSAAPAANGGLDLVMPGPDGPWGDALVAAVEAGDVAEAVIDDHVTRLLLLAERTGALGEPRPPPVDLPSPDSPRRRELLRRLAASAMTVLANHDSILPLEPGATVALIGRHAVQTICMGGGSAQVNPPYQVSVAEGLRDRLGERVTVTDGVEVRTRAVAARPEFVSNPSNGQPGVQVSVLRADGSVIEERHSDTSTTTVGFDDDFDEPVHAVRLRCVLRQGGHLEVGTLGVGSWRLYLGETEYAYQLATSGTGFGEAILAPPAETVDVDARAGDIIEATVVLLPATDSEGPATEPGMFGLIARSAPADQDVVIAGAVAAAGAADVAVVVVGLTEEQETESADKADLCLPGAQDALVTAVAGAARKTVVVVNAATPVLMPWLDLVGAVLWAGLPGQEGGHAVASALLGDIEPAGRLVTTMPADNGATPAWSVTPRDGVLEYTEGPFIGYRGHHSHRAPAPAFWFGHGLGYATWQYGTVQLATDGHPPIVSVSITNTGTRQSREVVQVYYEPAQADQPIRLVGWQAVSAGPGESVDVRVATDARLWRRWSTEESGWDTLGVVGRLVIARGLGDIRASVDLTP